MYEFGRILRHRYDGYLARKYDISQILVQTVVTNRCIQSASSLMMGLFPDSLKDPYPSNWNLVPVHTLLQDPNLVNTVF